MVKKGWYLIVPEHKVQTDKNSQVCDFDSVYRHELLNEFRGRPLELVEDEIFNKVEQYEKESDQQG